MKNLSALRAYAEGLETALACYETQGGAAALNVNNLPEGGE